MPAAGIFGVGRGAGFCYKPRPIDRLAPPIGSSTPSQDESHRTREVVTDEQLRSIAEARATLSLDLGRVGAVRFGRRRVMGRQYRGGLPFSVDPDVLNRLCAVRESDFYSTYETVEARGIITGINLFVRIYLRSALKVFQPYDLIDRVTTA